MKYFKDKKYKQPIDRIYTTRGEEPTFHVQRFINDYGKQKMEYVVPTLFNELPNRLKLTKLNKKIKHEMKTVKVKSKIEIR